MQQRHVEMIRTADRGIAVSNAITEVLEVADEVIGSNTQDSVPRYIQADWAKRAETSSG
jgi:hydroxymethylpyrimidine pyrophosphatase-like HAD family hydrolase